MDICDTLFINQLLVNANKRSDHWNIAVDNDVISIKNCWTLDSCDIIYGLSLNEMASDHVLGMGLLPNT